MLGWKCDCPPEEDRYSLNAYIGLSDTTVKKKPLVYDKADPIRHTTHPHALSDESALPGGI